MPRLATATLRQRNGRWYCRVSLGPKHRPGILLPTCRTEADAEARKVLLAELARKLRLAGQTDVAVSLLERAAQRDGAALADVCTAVDMLCAGKAVRPARAATTFGDVAKDWTSGNLAERFPDHVERKRSVSDDTSRLDSHVLPVVKDIPIPQFTLEHAEAVMRRLPESLSKGSRRHIAQLMSRVLNLAVYPLRLIAASPIPRGWLPSPGKGREAESIWPDEDARHMAHVARPLCYRVVLGFLAREGCRPGEAAALRWRDLDLDRSGITLDRNKTDDPRGWTLDAGVARGLRAWRGMREDRGDDVGPDAHVFCDELGRDLVRWIHDEDDPKRAARPELAIRADDYRAWLAEAGITRGLLFEENDKRRPTRIHDLRGLFVTTALANGRSESWVADRTGHKSSQMINRYRRRARRHEEANLGTLVALDVAIPELAQLGRELGPSSSACPPEAASLPCDSARVGHEGLEPSANGLREREAPRNGRDSSASRAIGGDHDTPNSSGPNSGPVADAVEVALADALTKAATAGRFDVVAQLSRELEARRAARAASNVVLLVNRKARR